MSLQYHRQVPVPGLFFQWQGMGPARTWRRSAATAYTKLTSWRRGKELPVNTWWSRWD